MRKRLSRFTKRETLTRAQRWELLLGPAGESAFKNDDERYKAWIQNRSELWTRSDCCWARIEYELGGFLPEERMRITKAEARLRRREGTIPE